MKSLTVNRTIFLAGCFESITLNGVGTYEENSYCCFTMYFYFFLTGIYGSRNSWSFKTVLRT